MTMGRIMMARTIPMKKIVPPVMPVGARIGSQPKRAASNVSTGAMTGRKTISPHRP